MNCPHKHETPLTTAVRRGVWAITSLAVPGWALAAPQGGQVVAGSASIAQQGNKTTITQSTAKGAINWQSFSIGTNEYVQFVQPGTTSVTLNRVVGNDPSQLLGQMSANGQIFLINPNGVYFGPNAVIDVAGLLATTFDISDDDFMAGRYTFARVDGRDPASVVNDGTINSDGGYVILAGDGVANHGLIEAHLGDIVMASGQQVTLDLGGDGLISFAIDGEALTEIAGVENTGELYADGGRIFLTAKVQGDLLPTAVNHEGLIQARTVEEREGIVYLGGAGGDVMVAGTIDADAGEANADGGTVRILSDRDITLSDGALVAARGNGTGEGGNARVIAAETLIIQAAATVTAEGGQAGEGGFIEVSGHASLQMRGEVDPGQGGTLLLDPSIINICGGTCSSAAGGISSTISENTIEGALGTGIDVVLVASNSIIGTELVNGINVSSSAGAGNLTLGIGQVTLTDPSPQPFSIPLFSGIDSPVDCTTGGLCTGTGSGAPNYFSYDPNVVGGLIDLKNIDLTPGGIDINGRLEIWAGLNGTIHAGSMRASGISVEGNILNTVSIPSMYIFSMEATSFGVDVSGAVRVDNSLGPSRIKVLGDSIRLGEIEHGLGSPSPTVSSTRDTQLIAGSGSLSVLGPLISRARGNGGAFVYAVAGGRIQFGDVLAQADGIGQANIYISGGQVAPLSGAMNLNAIATNGNAIINVGGGDGLSVGSVLAMAGGGGSANVGLYAGSGAFLLNGLGIAAFDFLAFDPQNPTNCATGGANCFTETTVTGSLGTVTGLAFPNYTMGTGTAQITISGATVDIRSPFRSVSTNIFGASGFLGAVGGQSATINVDATNGHLLLGSNLFPSGVNKPFLFAQSQTGPATIDLQATDGPLEVQRTVTPLISNSSVARYFTLYADALGSGSANVNLTTTGSTGGDILLDGGIRTSTPGGVANIALLTNEGISITSDALLLAEGRAANASISASDSTGTTGLISIDGDISALGRGSAQINVRNEGTGGIRLRGSLLASAESFFAQARFYSSGGTVDLAGAVQAIAPNFAMVDAITFINSNRMIIDGQLTAQADTNPYLYLFHQGTDFSIGSNALIESKSPTGAQADMDIAFGGALNIQDGALISAGSAIDIHTQSLQLDGAIRASRLSGDVTITIGPAAGPVTVGSTGLIQVQGGSGSGSHQIFIGSGTQNITNVQVDGVIEAVGAGQRSNVFINAGGINVTSGGRISAVNTGLGLGSIQLRSFSSGGIIAPGSIEAKQLLAINLGGGGIQITNPIVDGINLANVGSGSTGIIYTDPDLVQINQLRSDNGDIVINAGSITIGGSVLANGTADVILRSANDIVFGGFNQTMSGDVVILDASLGGSVISGTNTITANALSVLAANSIDLGFASIAVNNGIVPQTTYQFGDALMLSELASLGVTVPSVPIANAAFRALDINLGTFDFFGDYLYLQADQLTLNSAIGTWLPGTEPTPGTVNPDVIVQMQPYTQTQAIAIESLMPSSQLTGTTYFTQADHFSRFPGTTLLLGGASFAGPMFIGQNGTVNIGTKNFLALTSGPVTGAGNIVTSPPGLISVIGGVPTSPPSTTSSTTTTSTSTTLTSTEVVTTYVQQTTISDPTSPTEIGGSTITEEAVEMNLPVEEAVAGITPSEEETTSGTAAGNEPTIESSSEEAVAGTPLSEEETASGTEPGNEPTIESSSEEAVAGTTSSEEETASGTEAEDESAIELFSDEPIDMVAALEQQPLVETYLEINGITLACQ